MHGAGLSGSKACSLSPQTLRDDLPSRLLNVQTSCARTSETYAVQRIVFYGLLVNCGRPVDGDNEITQHPAVV